MQECKYFRSLFDHVHAQNELDFFYNLKQNQESKQAGKNKRDEGLTQQVQYIQEYIIYLKYF